METHERHDPFIPYYEPSKIYDHGRLEFPNELGIGFINGVWNRFEDARKSAGYLSKMAGGCNIHAVYNATHGRRVDIKECKMGLMFIATPQVRILHKMWDGFFDKSSANFLMICHSQGALHVRNALLDYPPELRKRILVVAIAPGGYIYRKTCLDVFHYRAHGSRDGVGFFDRAGRKREKKTTFILESHPDAPLFDHEFMSSTYKRTFEEHIQISIRFFLEEASIYRILFIDLMNTKRKIPL